MLNYYEGKPLVGSHLIDNIPEIKKQHSYHENVNRYSSRHKENIKLHGLLGSLILNSVDNETLKLLLAGELLHIGKNTSFGFGRYTFSTYNVSKRSTDMNSRQLPCHPRKHLHDWKDYAALYTMNINT